MENPVSRLYAISEHALPLNHNHLDAEIFDDIPFDAGIFDDIPFGAERFDDLPVDAGNI